MLVCYAFQSSINFEGKKKRKLFTRNTKKEKREKREKRKKKEREKGVFFAFIFMLLCLFFSSYVYLQLK